MRKHIIISLLLIISLHHQSRAQFAVKAQTGISYIEHFSTGLTFAFSGKHNVSLLYGSNFFIKPKDNSSYLIQYDRLINRIRFLGITPKIGIKGGVSFYTNEYYQWKLIVIVPFIGFNYHISNRIGTFLDLGIVYSREESLKRIKYGNIGNYKDYLPEIKLGLYFNLKN